MGVERVAPRARKDRARHDVSLFDSPLDDPIRSQRRWAIWYQTPSAGHHGPPRPPSPHQAYFEDRAVVELPPPALDMPHPSTYDYFKRRGPTEAHPAPSDKIKAFPNGCTA